jgi:hypothetical protein
MSRHEAARLRRDRLTIDRKKNRQRPARLGRLSVETPLPDGRTPLTAFRRR